MVNKQMDCWNTLIELKARKASISDAFIVNGFDFAMINDVINEGKRIINMQNKYTNDLAYNNAIVEQIDEEGNTYTPKDKILIVPTSEILDVDIVLTTYVGLD